MPTVPADTVLAQLRWRYATKKFDASKKIDAATWDALEQALVLAPSSYGLQPWTFLVIKDPSVRVKLRAASWNQPQITDASHMVVLCRKANLTAADVESFVARVAAVRNAPREALNDYANMMLGSVASPNTLPGGSMDTYTRSQTYIALGVLLSAAAMLGVDACPMEGFNPTQYDEILGLAPKGLRASVVCTLGYRAVDDGFGTMAKVRFPREAVIKHV